MTRSFRDRCTRTRKGVGLWLSYLLCFRLKDGSVYHRLVLRRVLFTDQPTDRGRCKTFATPVTEVTGLEPVLHTSHKGPNETLDGTPPGNRGVSPVDPCIHFHECRLTLDFTFYGSWKGKSETVSFPVFWSPVIQIHLRWYFGNYS